jgi:SWIM zinc finger
MTALTFTQALQADVASLQATHPILAGALDKAFALVAGGHVFPLEDGRSAHVRSQSNPARSHLVNGTCDCKATQYHAAPCAHRLALRLYQRTVEQLAGSLEEERWEPAWTAEATPPSLPEAPASVNCHMTIAGRQVQLTLRDTDEARLLERLAAVLAQYPVPQPAPQASSQHQGQGKDWCAKHQTTMQRHENAKGVWFSHFVDGTHCKGR